MAYIKIQCDHCGGTGRQMKYYFPNGMSEYDTCTKCGGRRYLEKFIPNEPCETTPYSEAAKLSWWQRFVAWGQNTGVEDE